MATSKKPRISFFVSKGLFSKKKIVKPKTVTENEIEERRRLKQLDPEDMLVTELKKAIKYEFPTAPKSGTKTELQIRLASFRSAAKHHPPTVYESEITDEELKGWS